MRRADEHQLLASRYLLEIVLRAIEMGEVTHIDETDLRQLQATNPDNVASLKQRLAMLNSRLGEN